jgi:small subunit ribosomal protein S8e
MGISRDSLHKKRLTGGKKHKWRKKRKHELGRQPSDTRIGSKNISLIRVRGGNFKKRALKLDYGNFSWISASITKKVRIISVAYNVSNNELVRTNTLVKNSIIYIDAIPFKNYLQKNNSKLFQKKDENQEFFLEQLNSGKILARICSRPGQVGRSDGYVLENAELEFYTKKIKKKLLNV